MNRNSPVPLWAVLAIGVVVLAGVYALAQRTVAPPQASTTVNKHPEMQNVSTPTPAATPLAVASATSRNQDTSKWKLYRNNKFHFEVRYPPGWTVSAPGEGAARLATADDRNITVARNLGDLGVSFEMDTLGSEEIGEYYRSAESLNDYLKLLASISATAVLRFVADATIGGRPVVKYVVCSKSSEAICSPRIYIQNGNVIYIIDNEDTALVDQYTFEAILTTVRLGDATQ